MQIITHRWLFLLLDSALVENDGAIGSYYVRKWHPIWLFCHFFRNPIFPGVFMTEAMAQLAGVWYGVQCGQRVFGYLRGIDRAKFTRVVFPGETLTIKVEPLKNKGAIAKFRGEVLVGEESACTAELTLTTPIQTLPQVATEEVVARA